MKEIIFETDIYAKESKNVLPFKIVIEKDEKDGYETLDVYRDTYNVISGKEIVDRQLLNGTMWKQ